MSTEDIVNIKGSTWVIPGATNIGVVENDGLVYLVDSGNDKESGRKINKILTERNWKLKGIINTHSNADHIGGNDYLQRMYGCEILTTRGEAPFVEMPFLESSLLWGGLPIKELRSKFFEAKPSSVTDIISHENIVDGFRFISLPGHFIDMAGVITEDNVFFLGDCMFGENILEKYGIPFIYDVAKYKKTIEEVRAAAADYYVLSHGGVRTEIDALADINLEMVERTESMLLEITAETKTFEDVLSSLCDVFGIRLNFAQYALVGSTVRSFLSYLYNSGRIGYLFENNRMYWKRK